MDVLITLQEFAEDPNEYEKILDPNTALQMAREILESRKDQVKAFDVKVDKKIKDAVKAAEDDQELKQRLKDREDERQKVITSIHTGKYDRIDYLGLDFKGLRRAAQTKSLVRVKEKGSRSVTTKKKNTELVRNALTKQCDFALPNVLRDAIIEKAAYDDTDAVKAFIAKSDIGIMNGSLYRHASRMYKLYQNLTREMEGSPAMSEEEAQMYIVRMYSDSRIARGYFDDGAYNKKQPISFEEIRKSNDFKIFRDNYAKLKTLEDADYTDQSLQKEQLEMSRNLRTMLITGVGINKTDEKGKQIHYSELNTAAKINDYNKEIGDAIDRHIKYMSLSAKVEKLIRAEVLEFRQKKVEENKNNQISFFFEERQMLALRKYLTSDIIQELNDGTEYNEENWKKKIKKAYENEDTRRYLLSGKDYYSSEDMHTIENARMDGDVNEEFLAKCIENSAIVFHGSSNRYQELDVDQKKLFALGLMMMDRGAIGYGTNGTNELLQVKKHKKIQTDQISAEIQKYIRGEEFHLNINYSQAFLKLFDVDDFAFIDNLPMSEG